MENALLTLLSFPTRNTGDKSIRLDFQELFIASMRCFRRKPNTNYKTSKEGQRVKAFDVIVISSRNSVLIALLPLF